MNLHKILLKCQCELAWQARPTSRYCGKSQLVCLNPRGRKNSCLSKSLCTH